MSIPDGIKKVHGAYNSFDTTAGVGDGRTDGEKSHINIACHYADAR